MPIKFPNQKGEIPIFSPAENPPQKFPLSRSEFLKGNKRTYFGPGQPPDAGYDSENYKAPTKWPTAGTILAVPQVVWLSSWLHDVHYQPPKWYHGGPGGTTPFIGSYESFWPDPNPKTRQDWYAGGSLLTHDPSGSGVMSYSPIGVSINSGQFSLNYYDLDGNPLAENNIPEYHPLTPPLPDTSPDLGDPDDGGGDGYEDNKITNPYPAEYERLRTVFLAAKTRIESLRPNRTYVEVPDYFTLSEDGLHETANYFYGQSESTYSYLHMIAPTDSTPYFGTRFLHIYAGDPARTNGDVPFVSPEPPANGTTESSDFYFGFGWQNLKRATGIDTGQALFSAFAIRLWSLPGGDKKGGDDEAGPTPPEVPPIKPKLFRRADKPSKTIEGYYYTHEADNFLLLNGTEHQYSFNPWYPAEVVLNSCGDNPAGFFVPWDHLCYDQTALDTGAQHGLDHAVENYNAETVEPFNTSIINTARGRRDLLKEHARYFADQGVDARYEGTTGKLTVDSLVRYIAKHFNFDPETGEDLIDK